jgi:hypothetical protein
MVNGLSADWVTAFSPTWLWKAERHVDPAEPIGRMPAGQIPGYREVITKSAAGRVTECDVGLLSA